jgi:hypothetical protein
MRIIVFGFILFNKATYSQTCIMRSPLGQRKNVQELTNNIERIKYMLINLRIENNTYTVKPAPVL